jgi:hypothetical protein
MKGDLFLGKSLQPTFLDTLAEEIDRNVRSLVYCWDRVRLERSWDLGLNKNKPLPATLKNNFVGKFVSFKAIELDTHTT